MVWIWCALFATAHADGPRSCEPYLSVDKPFLYRVEDGAHESQLFGSRHFGVPLGALSTSVHRSIEIADTFVFETREPRSGARPPGRRLSAALSLDAWSALIDRLGAKGVPAAVVDDLSPALAYFLLSTEPDHLANGRMDVEIRDFARRRGARVKALESVSYQEQLLEQLVDARELERALLRPDGAPAPDLTYYLRGDARAGEDALNVLRRDHAEVYDRLVVRRNHAWIPKILGAHRRRGRTLFVIGALHLGGPDGLIHLLRERGLRVRRER